MPQTTNEQRARWPGYDKEAMDFLKTSGYELTKNWEWKKPDRDPTPRELDAIGYLVHEWDFGMIEDHPEYNGEIWNTAYRGL
jgi:hypothetical protein